MGYVKFVRTEFVGRVLKELGHLPDPPLGSAANFS